MAAIKITILRHRWPLSGTRCWAMSSPVIQRGDKLAQYPDYFARAALPVGRIQLLIYGCVRLYMPTLVGAY